VEIWTQTGNSLLASACQSYMKTSTLTPVMSF